MLTIVQDNTLPFVLRHDGFVQGVFRGDRPFYPRIGENVIACTYGVQKPPLEGYILWQLDLSPLEEEHFSTLADLIETFVQEMYEPTKGRTFGICLYKGALQQEEQFTLLKHLAALLPEEPPLFIMLEGSTLDEATFLQLTNKEKSFPFHQIIRHKLIEEMPYSFDALGWGFSTVMGAAHSSQPQPLSKRLSDAMLLPHSSCKREVWERFVSHLPLAKELEARLVPEALLTEMWEGIDNLYVMEDCVTPQGKRKIAGYLAAGGELHYL